MKPKYEPIHEVVDYAVHRVPPEWRKVRSAGGNMVKVLKPETTRQVPILGMRLVRSGIRYRGLGAKDLARRERALAS